MRTMTESRPPAPGQQHSYEIDPPAGSGCEAIWMIDGEPVTVHSEEGGLRVLGVGGSGVLTVEVIGDVATTKVSVRIDCPDLTSVSYGPMVVGSGRWEFDPCSREPCMSAVDAYDAAVTDGQTTQRGVDALCQRLRRLYQRFVALFLLLTVLLALTALCNGVVPVPLVCQVLYWITVATTLEFIRLYARIIVTQNTLDANEAACRAAQVNIDRAFNAMRGACPPECQLPRVQLSCNCN